MTHSSIDPSWLPHAPANLYSHGLAEWLFSTTSLTDMSLPRNTPIRHAIATSASTPCTTAIGRTAASSSSPSVLSAPFAVRRRPSAASASCSAASAAASHSAARPVSAIIA